MRGIKITIGPQKYDNYPVFLEKLSKLYNGKTLCVRWFMQESTFSYEIFHRDEAFLGTPLFTSEVFWTGNDELKKILRDINKNLKICKQNLKQNGSSVSS